MYSEQFEIPNASMEEVKDRVKYWLSSFQGAEYLMEVVSERHVKISKTKHDLKICAYGCIVYIISIAALPFIVFPMVTSPATALTMIFTYMLVILLVLPIFIGLFCLKPNKAEFDVRFSMEYPIRVMIVASGNMLKDSMYDYDGFKEALNPSGFVGGPGLSS